MMENSSANYSSRVRTFCDTAIYGLQQYYNEDSEMLPYTTRLEQSKKWNLHGRSVRYAAIAHIGITRWLACHPQDQKRFVKIWGKILKQIQTISNIGDVALCLWAGTESQDEGTDEFALKLSEVWKQQKHLCNAVELGWIVQAGTLYMYKEGKQKQHIAPVLDEAHRMLKELFSVRNGLFQRHKRGSFLNIGRRVSCFADQVYPILAMATYGRIFNDKWSKDTALLTVETICKHQGSMGQWMWHYDVEEGKVCEEYPVFSVHQHSMAPMCILACDKVNKTDHTKNIQVGMQWLFGDNELNQNLVCENDGLIWRDIERKEPLKISRFLRGLCCVCGLNKLHLALKGSPLGYKINYECRPYELGWILYAWADYKPQENERKVQ